MSQPASFDPELAFEPEPAEPERRLSRDQLWALFGPLFRRRWPHFAGAFLLLVISSGLVVAGPLLIKRAIDRDIASGDTRGLLNTVLLYLGTQLGHMVALYIMRNWLEWAGQDLMAVLKQRLVRHLLALPVAFFDRHSPGQLLSRVENDTASLRMLFTTTTVMLVGDAILFVGMFGAMAWVSPRLTLVTASMIPVLLGGAWFFQHRAFPYMLDVRKLTAEICGRLAEFVKGMPVLQAFAREPWALGRFQAVNRRKVRQYYIGDRFWLVWFNLTVMLETIAFVLILGVGGAWTMAGLVTIGTLAMFLGYVRRFFEPIHRLSDQFATIQRATAGAERIVRLLDEPVTVADPDSPRDWPGLGEGITFENVWFRYADDGEWILQDVSFHLPAGERWALIGPTGAGKTTLAALLLRFRDPTRGRILIDGIDLRDLAQGDLRRQVGLVLQDLYLFPGDLAANLTLDREVSEAQLREATRLTLADDVIRRLPGGEHAILAEAGSNLSAGERQLLAFTRALVHEPPLLILDEATSAVDPATEARIERSLTRILESRTALVIAHRLSTIKSCHRILVLRGGRIEESGTHRELMAAGGLYRDLHDLQFREDRHAPAAS